MSRIVSAIAFILFILSFPIVAAPLSDAYSEKLHRLFDEEWQARLNRDPMLASQHGEKASDGLLMDVSDVAYQQWKQASLAFVKRLEAIPLNELSETDQVNYQIFSQQLQRRISEINFKTYQIPFLADSGFHTQIMGLPRTMGFKTEADYHNYISRLAAIPRYFDQHIANMKNGLARNFSMPSVVMNGFTDVLKSVHSVDVSQSSFMQPLESMPAGIDASRQQLLRLKAKKVISTKVIPAFKSLDEFFSQTYIPKTKKSLGAYDFPEGSKFYSAQVAHYTTLDLTPAEIHKIGLDEVARIREEMAEVIRSSGFEGNFKAFLRFLRESPQFYAKTDEELLQKASYIAKRMDGQLPKLFKRLPRQPYTVEAVPASIAPKYTTGRYVSAPLESERPGTYWVNTYSLDKRPLYVLEALTLHEAVPGHHLQIALNKELNGLPNFRRHSYISAFGEGWGLYSERLGLEVGFYQDPYSNFGRLTYEMWRAARLVIDTGIHAMGWSRERAIKLLQENSALSLHNIETEVDRYISWPAQALSYKLGEIKIRELRQRAEAKLGDRFDRRDFHDEVLKNGAIPLNILELQIDRYIAEVLESPSAN